MKASVSDFESDLRISPRLVSALLIILSVALAVAGELLPDLLAWEQAFNLVLLLFVVSAGIWLLDGWSLWVGRWFAIVALVVLVYLGDRWLGMVG